MSFKNFSTGLGGAKSPPANDAAKPGVLHDQPAAANAPAGDKPAAKP